MALGREVNTLLRDVFDNQAMQKEVATSVSHYFFTTFSNYNILQLQIRNGASGARSDDTSTMKGAVLTWLQDSITASGKSLLPSEMSTRGHHHPVTSQLLTPVALGPWTPE